MSNEKVLEEMIASLSAQDGHIHCKKCSNKNWNAYHAPGECPVKSEPVSKVYDVKLLQQAADDACDTARDHKREITSSVNWGDIGCSRIEITEDDSGNLHYRLVFEEAEPEAESFISFIENELINRGFGGVEVVTEW